MEEGPCSGNFERWYFDNEADTCKPFRYGGCKGTKNNFVSEAACKYQCKNPSVQKGKFYHLLSLDGKSCGFILNIKITRFQWNP